MRRRKIGKNVACRKDKKGENIEKEETGEEKWNNEEEQEEKDENNVKENDKKWHVGKIKRNC